MSERLNKAIVYASNAHLGQLRKMSNLPYIVHPMEVASIIGSIKNDEDLIIAGLLHDTVEDCGVDPFEIRDLFGKRVYQLVLSETEDKMSSRSEEETWMERKEESLLMLENTKDLDVKILWLSDKLSNLRSFYNEYLKIGNHIYDYLHQKDPKMQKWYYTKVLESTKELKDTLAYKEAELLIENLFNEE